MDNKLQVLIVEDNPADVMLIEMAMQAGGLECRTQVAVDGDAAIHHLQADPGDDLIILDLNLPKRHGTEVLRVIRETERGQQTPVVVLSSSPGDVIEELVHAAHLEADCYLTKPLNLDDFLALGDVIRKCYESRTGRPTRG
jgi:DNA-binding response OmpR family regulator